jgi:hypothetical protein
MRNLRLLAGLTAVLLMSGCATEPEPVVVVPNPAASPSSEPSSAPTPTFESKATTAVIYGTRVEFQNSAGHVIDSASFDSASAEFLSKMRDHFGAAEATYDDGICAYDTFGDGFTVPYRSDGSYGAELMVYVPAVNGVRVEIPGGISVGEDAAALAASVSPELKRDWEGSGRKWSFIYDVAGWWGLNTTEARQYGAKAWVEDGTLTRIMVPADVGSMHTSC